MRRVAGDQAHGELLQVLEGDAIAGERTHARVHAVDQVAPLQDPVNHIPRTSYTFERLAGDLDAGAATGDANYLLDGEVVAGKRHIARCGMRERQGILRP